MHWLRELAAKAIGWALVLAAAIGGILAALSSARRAGARAERQAAQSAAQQDTIHAQDTRAHVDTEVSKLPDAPTQRLGDADPGTAAGHLHGWLRDGSEDGR